MNTIENLREKLHKVMETGKIEDILRISQELDKLILHYYLSNKETSGKQSA